MDSGWSQISRRPGARNSFSFATDVVINEIFYQGVPLPEVAAVPATRATTELLVIDDAWRYNQSGTNLGTNWARVAHAVDNRSWFTGAGVLARETTPAALPEPIRTPLLLGPTTYYFETEFEVADDADLDDVALEMDYVVDDGAVFLSQWSRDSSRANGPPER